MLPKAFWTLWRSSDYPMQHGHHRIGRFAVRTDGKILLFVAADEAAVAKDMVCDSENCFVPQSIARWCLLDRLRTLPHLTVPGDRLVSGLKALQVVAAKNYMANWGMVYPVQFQVEQRTDGEMSWGLTLSVCSDQGSGEWYVNSAPAWEHPATQASFAIDPIRRFLVGVEGKRRRTGERIVIVPNVIETAENVVAWAFIRAEATMVIASFTSAGGDRV